MNFKQIETALRAEPPKKMVVVGAGEKNILLAVCDAAKHNIVQPILLGDQKEILEIARANQINLADCTIENIKNLSNAAARAMALVAQKQVEVLMKGTISTAALMKIAFKNGIQKNANILSHITLFDAPALDRLLLVSDAGLLPFPTLDQRVGIIKNAVNALKQLGTQSPKIAVLSASEDISDKIPISQVAVTLKKLNQKGKILDGFGTIEGPLDFFAAMDKNFAIKKGITTAGDADILHCPDVVAGNLLCKALTYFTTDIRTGGCIVGGQVPIVLLSRVSPADDKYCSILTALACSAV